jgi:hypothetical protein
MWLYTGIILVLSCVSGIWANSEAQVLITNRGEPAPFPHFPSVNVVPVVAAQPVFHFAPTPNGRQHLPPNPAAPTLFATPAVPFADPQPLPDVQQRLGTTIYIMFFTQLKYITV